MSDDEGVIGHSAPFSLNRLIICEGPDDVAFLQRLLAVRGLPACHVRHTGQKRSSAGGNTKFADALSAVRINRNFNKIRKILLVSDNDLTPAKSLENMQKQVDKAGFGPAPKSELVPTDAKPIITIMMLPLDGAQEKHHAKSAHLPPQVRSA